MWSDPKIDSVVRVVPCRTLDGTRLVIEITIGLKRTHTAAVAQTIGDEVAAVLEEVVGEQIVQGQFPLTPAELEALVVRRANATNNRVASVKVALQKRVPSVAAGRRSQTPRGMAAADAPAFAAPPAERPPRQGSAPSTTRLSTNPPGSVSRSAAPAASGTSRAWPAAARVLSPPSVPSSSISGTSQRVSAGPPGLEDAARRSITPVGIPAPPRVPPWQEIPTGTRSPSRPPSVHEPPPVSTRRESTRPPSTIPPETLDALSEGIARLLRRVTAETLVSVFAAAASESVDLLSLLEGKGPTAAIVAELSSCFAAAAYQAATNSGAPHRRAIAVVESACRKASVDGTFATDIGRYIGGHAQLHDLAARLAEALSLPTQEGVLRRAIAPHHAAVLEQLGAMAFDIG